MTVVVTDSDFTLHVGDVLDVLPTLPAGSVDCVVTSPPYWGLRDYSVDGQLGLEPTPGEYVENLVGVFQEVRRVLADHGTVWLNLGDSYVANAGTQAPQTKQHVGSGYCGAGLKPKDMVGIPWRTAFALQADGWYLRSEITWCKSNCMPESVTDRPTKATEKVFLLAKQPRYWYDAEAVREPQSEWTKAALEGKWQRRSNAKEANRQGSGWREKGHNYKQGLNPAGRNLRDWWEIATQPYAEAHFATFPEKLVEKCLLAGCPQQVCRVCGRPRERIVDSRSVSRPDLPRDHPEWRPSRYDNGKAGDPQSPGPGQRFSETATVGWSDCGHHDYQPGTVLDMFIGSGTTALVARKHGRRTIGIELNPAYAQLAARRLQQLSLLA